MGDDTDEIEMDPMDMRRPAASADADRARAKDLRTRVLSQAQDAAGNLGNDDSNREEHAAAVAQLKAAKETLAMRASEATETMNAREDRLERAAAAEARGDLTAAAELREGAALADAQYQGYVTTVAQEQARVDALTQDVERLDAWADAAQARAEGRVAALSGAEKDIDDLEDRAARLTTAELHDRTSRLYREEAERLEAEGHVAEASALWDAANAELSRADEAWQQAAAFEVDESAFAAAGLESPAADDVTGAQPTLDPASGSAIDAPVEDGPTTFGEPSAVDAPAAFDEPSPGFDQPSPGLDAPAAFDEPSPGFDGPAAEPPQDFVDAPVDDGFAAADEGFDTSGAVEGV